MPSTPSSNGTAGNANKGSNATSAQPKSGEATSEPAPTTAEWKAFSDGLFTSMLDMPPIPVPEHLRTSAYARGGDQPVAELEAKFSTMQEKYVSEHQP
ncbi:hypothetical protein LTR56_016995 [Elasticomyces elasticus]|nr:hypothetical protein LTR56_016995 [Elasticomyces elasticus]KAK4912110.1 hypothetical protein LTR49_019396 [Elasticomyces elasticus]